MKVVDGQGAVLGRMATRIAKSLLNGESVQIINAEKVIITGNRKATYEKYKQRFDRSDKANPRHGPKFPRTPEGIVKRAVRGMVNYKSKRGREAYKRLRVYFGEPENTKATEKIETREILGNHITVLELSNMLGWKNPMEE